MFIVSQPFKTAYDLSKTIHKVLKMPISTGSQNSDKYTECTEACIIMQFTFIFLCSLRQRDYVTMFFMYLTGNLLFISSSTILFWDSTEVTAYDSKSKIILMDLLRLSSTLVHPLKQAILKPLLVTATLKCKTLPLTAKKPNV